MQNLNLLLNCVVHFVEIHTTSTKNKQTKKKDTRVHLSYYRIPWYQDLFTTLSPYHVPVSYFLIIQSIIYYMATLMMIRYDYIHFFYKSIFVNSNAEQRKSKD